MKDAVVVQIGRIAVELQGDSSELAELKHYYAAFCGGTPELTLRLSPQLSAEAVTESGTHCRFSKNEWILTGEGLFRVRIDRRSATGELAYVPTDFPGHAAPRPLAVHRALKALVCTLLLQGQHLLLHAAAVSVGDNGVLLVGASGEGKSTVASMYPREEVLGDELVAVRLDGGTPVAHSTPFGGDLPPPLENRKAPVVLGLQLRQANGTRTTSLTSGEALYAILKSATVPEGAPDLEAAAFEASAKLASHCAWGAMEFTQDRHAVPAAVSQAMSELTTCP
jgi:hypothetical protein